MGISLGPNQYGKAEVRVVTVERSAAAHVLRDLNVSSALRGDFTAVHVAGDNAHVLATDTQKNTVHALARDGIGEIEEFAVRLARHFAGAYDRLSGARVEIEEYGWDRIAVDGRHTPTPSRGPAVSYAPPWSRWTASTRTSCRG